MNWNERLEAYLRQRSDRFTARKRLIAAHVATRNFFTADDIRRHFDVVYPTADVSMATIYRTLQLLIDAELLVR